MHRDKIWELLMERFRCPDIMAEFAGASNSSGDSDCWPFGLDAIGFGALSSAVREKAVQYPSAVACRKRPANGLPVELPSDLAQIVDHLRLEQYVIRSAGDPKNQLTKNAVRNLYYLARPFLPVAIRKQFQKLYFRGWEEIPFPSWPVDVTVENIFEHLLLSAMQALKLERLPFIWFWPDGAPECAMLTHDVETSAGLKFCQGLMDLNDSFGIKSSFQIVPEQRYRVRATFLESIRRRGFEVNVHDLDHDGHLFSNRAQFLRRVVRINNYGRQWGAVGFRSAVLYRNPDWFSELDFDYDMSIPNVAHLDPQRGGCCTVFPYLIGDLVELPVTATQDYSIFHVIGEYSTQLWQQQMAIIQARHGLMSFIVHPDYIISEKPRRVYTELLRHLAELRSQGETWIALPREVAAWWRMRSEMNLVKENGAWRIEGKGSARARIAYAVRSGDGISYRFEENA